MTSRFYDKYRNLSKEELFEIVLASRSYYQPEAIIAATLVITQNNWTAELNKRIEEKTKLLNKEKEQADEEIVEKAEYYSNVLDLKKQGNSFQVRIADIPKFEASLAENDIEFYREDKHIGVQLDNYPTQTYFFKNKDIEAVDKISIELGLITTPYVDIKPFFGFEVKIVLIVVAVILLILMFALF